MIQRAEFEYARDLLSGAERVLIVTHTSPDGDAIGSLLGLGHALRAAGKTVIEAVDGGVPGYLAFLPGADRVLERLDSPGADLIITTDCSDERRYGEAGKAARALGVPTINIDHHRTNTLFGDANLVDVQTVSTTEGVMDWLTHMGLPIPPDSAECLLCGFVTDTMAFRTDNVTAATLDKVADLMALGPALYPIVHRTLNTLPTAVIRLWAHVMPTMRIEEGVIWVRISLAAQMAAQAFDGRHGGLPNFLLQADEAVIAAVLTEEEALNPDGSRSGAVKVDISLRAKPGYDVAQVALALGGGGHMLAAGAEIAADLDTVEARAIPLLKDAARQGRPKFA